ncbi:MAG: uracil phosphoribosyltransferase [Deltaproteobacteria bacterium]|nr:MAG: uracil phosphoribosyltransferase [Deltaproteobacteria bacterium]
MRDHFYDQVPWRLSEMEHRYGENVHILADPLLLGQLATLCQKETVQPHFNRIVAFLYHSLAHAVINSEFPRRHVSVPTRMADVTPGAIFHGQVIEPETRVVTVNIARAGTLPSQITFDMLNTVLDPRRVRQDHIIMERRTDAEGHVVGTDVGGSKIGGDVDDAIVLFPDPMGATGGSLCRAVTIYKDQIPGRPKRLIAMHLIITPDYLRRVRDEHPDVVVYALRLDRGTSDEAIFETVPGEQWDKESGLNETQYIVPGGGGFGELMNNSYV